MKKNEKRRMQRLGDPTAENVGRSSPMSESIARLAAPEQYRPRKAIFSKRTKWVFENAERASRIWMHNVTLSPLPCQGAKSA
ncbi:MAG: hypothetical protein PHH77_08745 [Victivallaceae bacterium]|nr:hypothetical protein [Victivallaceae bacterium]